MQRGTAACLLLRVVGTRKSEMVDHRLCPLHLQGLGAGKKQQYQAANAAVLAPSLLQGSWDSSEGVLLTAAGSRHA